jgi:plastocyanin
MQSIARISKVALSSTLALGLIASGCGGSTDFEATVSRGGAGAGAVQIVAENVSFIPDRLELETGSEVSIEIVNQDDLTHDFAINDFRLNTGIIKPGETVTVTLTVPAGTTDFRCTLHELTMTGEIQGG